jgi:hypothetical protein
VLAEAASRLSRKYDAIAQIATATLTKNPAITHKGTANPLIKLKTPSAAKQADAQETMNKRAIWQKVHGFATSGSLKLPKRFYLAWVCIRPNPLCHLNATTKEAFRT